MADDIIAWFADETNSALVARLTAYGLQMSAEVRDDAALRFSGRTVVLTGTISHINRSELREWLELNGATVSNSVSKRTSFVIAGENAGSNLVKARKLGVNIWDKDRLLEEVKQNPHAI